jgi:hypothetical protein
MIEDPIVDEVRKIRQEYARQFNYDLDAICKDLQEKQAASGRKIVSFPPIRPDRRRTVPSAAPVQKTAGDTTESGVNLLADG